MLPVTINGYFAVANGRVPGQGWPFGFEVSGQY